MNSASSPSPSPASVKQARKLADQLRPRIVEAILAKRIPAPGLQELIEREAELSVGSHVVNLLVTLIGKVKWTKVVSDYGAKDAIAKAIKDCGFKRKHLDLPLDQIPLVGIGIAAHEVGDMHFNEKLTIKETLSRVTTPTQRFADPLTSLRYVAGLSSRERRHPRITIFRAVAQHWYMMTGLEDGQPTIGVHRTEAEGWMEASVRCIVRRDFLG